MKKSLILMALLCLCACAKHVEQPQLADTPAVIWQEMLAFGVHNPYRMQLSLRFGQEGDTRRVTAILWGNNDEALRLDVQAGVGVTIAKILQAGDHFLLYVPQENRVYTHDGANRPLLRVGTPLPFTLAQLADMLNGRFGDVFGNGYSKASPAGAGLTAYDLEGAPGGQLELGANGMPQTWKEAKGWRMAISYGESKKGLPDALRMFAPDGKKAILLVKNRETPATPFTREQMELSVPPGAQTLPLSKYKPS